VYNAAEDSPAKASAMVQLKKDWRPTESAFHRLLAWLDEGTDSNGERYLEVRRRLELYFERKNCLCPDELADETLTRVARKLDEQGGIEQVTPLQYCYIVAKFVFLESLRAAGRGQTSLDDPLKAKTLSSHSAGLFENQERRLDDLERCLTELPRNDQELIREYYHGQQREKIERRVALAARLGLSPNALTIRACRIRAKLEACMKKRMGEGPG
jgi:DNA-directed RNA polymerase specialized sigma24 family protein